MNIIQQYDEQNKTEKGATGNKGILAVKSLFYALPAKYYILYTVLLGIKIAQVWEQFQ
jgi:hypothetical protein